MGLGSQLKKGEPSALSTRSFSDILSTVPVRLIAQWFSEEFFSKYRRCKHKVCARLSNEGGAKWSARMIPELSTNESKEELLPKPTKMTADDLHKILINVFDNKDQKKETKEQIDKMLLEYAYRGSNLMYSSNPLQ